jgi:hypothetical protein
MISDLGADDKQVRPFHLEETAELLSQLAHLTVSPLPMV